MSAKRFRPIVLVAVAAVLAILFAVPVPAGADELCANGATQGCWSAPFSPFGEFDANTPQTPAQSMKYPTAASIVVLPDGRLVYWNGLQNLEDARGPLALDAGGQSAPSKTAMLDLTGSEPTFFLDAVAPAGDDLFCTDQRLTSGGKLIAVGGTHWQSEVATPQELTDQGAPRGLTELYGSKQTHRLDAVSATPGVDTTGSATTWSLQQSMKWGRWYPTLITLPDGEELVSGGVAKLLWNSSVLDDLDNDDTDQASDVVFRNVNQTEIRNNDTGVWTENPAKANITTPLFSRQHLLPNGAVIYSGTGQQWGPAGQAVEQGDWSNIRTLDVTDVAAIQAGDVAWQTVGSLPLGFRGGAFSVMLPLQPNPASGEYNRAEILVGGGVLGLTVANSPGTYVATNVSEKIVVHRTGTGEWKYATESTPGLVNRRWFSSGVLLPNGQVVAVNGADADEVIMPGPEHSVRQAELWDGTGWVALSSGSRDRTYHNSAILLPDGSVLVGGHAPINQYYGDKGAPQSQPGGVAGFKDPSFERLFPPYIASGNARPVVTSASAHRTWGEDVTVNYSTSGASIQKIVLVRLPSFTHATDADMRAVELVKTSDSAGQFKAKIPAAPAGRSVVPPGYYYVFALAANGTPSVATVLRVDGSSDGSTGTPVNVADTLQGAAAAPVTPVDLPAKAIVGQAPTPILAVADEAPRPTLPASEGAESRAWWLVTLAGLAGVVLTRRARTARSRA